MAEDKKRAASIQARSDRLNNQKACFELDDKMIFINLHNAATQKAAEKLHKTFPENVIHDIFINTGISEDGRTIANPNIVKDKSHLFQHSKHQYEVGLVLQYTEFKAPNETDIRTYGGVGKAVLKLNKDGFAKMHKVAFETLSEYFKFFADQTISDEKMVEFIPDYNGENIKINNYSIISMDDKKKEEYFSNRKKDPSENSKGFVPRLGYKFGYTIEYGKTGEETTQNTNVSKNTKETK